MVSVGAISTDYCKYCLTLREVSSYWIPLSPVYRKERGKERVGDILTFIAPVEGDFPLHSMLLSGAKKVVPASMPNIATFHVDFRGKGSVTI